MLKYVALPPHKFCIFLYFSAWKSFIFVSFVSFFIHFHCNLSFSWWRRNRRSWLHQPNFRWNISSLDTTNTRLAWNTRVQKSKNSSKSRDPSFNKNPPCWKLVFRWILLETYMGSFLIFKESSIASDIPEKKGTCFLVTMSIVVHSPSNASVSCLPTKLLNQIE